MKKKKYMKTLKLVQVKPVEHDSNINSKTDRIKTRSDLFANTAQVETLVTSFNIQCKYEQH